MRSAAARGSSPWYGSEPHVAESEGDGGHGLDVDGEDGHVRPSVLDELLDSDSEPELDGGAEEDDEVDDGADVLLGVAAAFAT